MVTITFLSVLKSHGHTQNSKMVHTSSQQDWNWGPLEPKVNVLTNEPCHFPIYKKVTKTKYLPNFLGLLPHCQSCHFHHHHHPGGKFNKSILQFIPFYNFSRKKYPHSNHGFPEWFNLEKIILKNIWKEYGNLSRLDNNINSVTSNNTYLNEVEILF